MVKKILVIINKKSRKQKMKLFEAAHPICVSELFCLRRCDIMCCILFVWHFICFRTTWIMEHFVLATMLSARQEDHGTLHCCHQAILML